MKKLAILASVGAGSLAMSAPALADGALPPARWARDLEDAVNRIAIVGGAAIRVGEGPALPPRLGIETGVVPNVFFQNSSPVTAGLLRILAEVGTGSLPDQR